jgi:primary-amine oxidase
MLKGKRDARLSALYPRNETQQSCEGTGAVSITAPRQNIWDQLDDAEAAGVVAWLFAQPEFNLTVAENATTWDNSV